MLEELRQRPDYGKIEFLRLNFDTESEFKKRFNVPVRSVIMLFRNGKEVERITSNADKGVIEALLKKAL